MTQILQNSGLNGYGDWFGSMINDHWPERDRSLGNAAPGPPMEFTVFAYLKV